MNAQINLQDGLVAYYPFNGNADDESGNKYHGTVNGVPEFISGFLDNCLQIETEGQYVEIPSITANLDVSEKTFSIWFYTKGNFQNEYNQIFDRTAGDGYALNIHYHDNICYLRFSVHSDIHYTYEHQIKIEKWNHVVVSKNNSNIKLYLNNKIIKEFSVPYITESSALPLIVGAGGSPYDVGYSFSGLLDEFRIYNRTLTEEEISAIYTNYKVSVTPGLTNTKVGSIIEFAIKSVNSINEIDNIISYQFNCSYDNTKLEYISTSLSGTIAEGGIVNVNTNSESSFNMGYMRTTPISSSGSGDLVKIKFKVIDCGISGIKISNFKFNNIDVKNIQNAYITAEYAYGDVDLDGMVLVYDAALTLQYSVGLDPLPIIDPLPWERWREKIADVDNIIGVTANDAAEIMKYSIGEITHFPIEDNKKNTENKDTDVLISVENNEIVFKSNGDLFGFNLVVQNAIGLEEPIFLNTEKFLSEKNITATNYSVGICTGKALREGTPFMKIPFTLEEDITFNLVINGESKIITVNLTIGIAKIEDKVIHIYPNPIRDKLIINDFKRGSLLEIFSISGKLVKQQNINNADINISDLPKGIYIVKVRNNEKVLTTKRIIKQ